MYIWHIWYCTYLLDVSSDFELDISISISNWDHNMYGSLPGPGPTWAHLFPSISSSIFGQHFVQHFRPAFSSISSSMFLHFGDHNISSSIFLEFRLMSHTGSRIPATYKSIPFSHGSPWDLGPCGC